MQHRIQVLFILAFITLPLQAGDNIIIIDWDSNFENSQQTSTRKSSNKQSQVDLYITSWCPYCKKAMAYLNSKGIKFNQYDIEKDLQAAIRKRNLAPNYRGVPLAVINGKTIKGFNKKSYQAALKK